MSKIFIINFNHMKINMDPQAEITMMGIKIKRSITLITSADFG